jgi:ribonuclease D
MWRRTDLNVGETAASAYRFIANDDALTAWRSSLPAPTNIALDTEFERQRTYFAELCLVQVAAGGAVACIDPFALDRPARALEWLLAVEQPLIVHAGRQDLELVYQLTGGLPARVFDTQIAAALLGYGDNTGYADLVRQVLGVALDKSQTRTDWRQRPLSSAQLAYAANDVRHLPALAVALEARLLACGRDSWAREDCAALSDTRRYAVEDGDAWQRVRALANVATATRARGAALAAWREGAARARNLPRGWILRDDELLRVAEGAPRTLEQLVQLLPNNAAALRRFGASLLEVCAKAGAAPPATAKLSAQERASVRRIADAASHIAQSLDINVALLINRREMEGLVRGERSARLRQGWRAECLGELLASVPAAASSACCGV